MICTSTNFNLQQFNGIFRKRQEKFLLNRKYGGLTVGRMAHG
jgi:hypothetical protein